MPRQNPIKGILMMLVVTLCFASLDASTKFLSPRVPLPMLVWMRYLVHCLLMVIFLAPSMRGKLLSTGRPGALIVRGLVLILTTGLGMAAFRALPLAEATSIIFLSPVLVALLAGPVLGEKISGIRWLAMLAGFSGVVLIARPGGAINITGLLLALATAFTYAVYQIQTRHLAATENTWTMLFYTALLGTLVLTLALPFYGHELDLSPFDWLILCSLGLYGGVGHFLLTAAFRLAPASSLSPFLYVQLAWATLFGALLFGHWPDGWSFFGMGVITASSLGLLWAENRQRASA